MGGFQLPILGLVSHAQKVKSLYKRALRNLKAYNTQIPRYRYEATLLRARFDENVCIHDIRKAKEMLKQGEEELFLFTHYSPLRFPKSYLGVAYERHCIPPDWVVDYWHPLEKAQYPVYFARREQRKIEYIREWNKKYAPERGVEENESDPESGSNPCNKKDNPMPDNPCL